MDVGRLTAGGAVFAAALAMTAGAEAASVTNGNFERGSLSGWEKQFRPNGECGFWRAHSGPYVAPSPRGIGLEPVLPAQPQGQFAAVAAQPECPSRQILSQVVKLRANRTHRLRFKLAYRNENDGMLERGGPANFITPSTLSLSVPNQQFRMDVIKPGAPIASVKPRHVLKRVYRTKAGDADVRAYRRVAANLSELAGREVRLRFAVVVNEAPIWTGIDAVKVRTKSG